MSAQGLYTAAERAGCGLLFLEALIPAAQTTEILTLLNGSSKGANIWKAVWRRQVNLGDVQRGGIGKGFMSPEAGEWLEGIHQFLRSIDTSLQDLSTGHWDGVWGDGWLKPTHELAPYIGGAEEYEGLGIWGWF